MHAATALTAIRNVFVCMIVSVQFIFAGAREARADDVVTGKFIFEYCHRNAGRELTLSGFFIDAEGSIWIYNHSGEPWSPMRADGLLYEYDLKEKYRDAKPAGTVDKAVFSAMVSLIEPASKTELKQRKATHSIGSLSYAAYLYDPAGDTYREVILSSKGDPFIENASGAARTLVQWLESVLTQQPVGPSHGGSEKTPPRGRIRAVNPEIKTIQKIPASKPEIRVEQTGPFPVEDSEKKDQ